MSITGVAINTRDLDVSIAFYTHVVDARVTTRTTTRAELEVAGGRLVLRSTAADAPTSEWVPDDLQRGFRHLGFKVDDVDAAFCRATSLAAPVHLEPLEAAGEVRIAFVFDPDGVLVEFVERHLAYDQVVNADAVAAEHALPSPARPRLDHVAVSVEDRDATVVRWEAHGGVCAGTLAVPGDARGLQIAYVHDGGVVLEVFTFSEATRPAPAIAGAAGLHAVLVDHDDAPEHARHEADGLAILADAALARSTGW